MVKKPPVNAGDIRDVGSLDQENPLGKGMTTHSSILACRIPCGGASGATVHRVTESDTIEVD